MAIGNRPRRAAWLLGLLTALVGSLALFQDAYAQPASRVEWGRTIGNFCVEGVRDASRTVSSRDNVNGLIVEEFNVDYRPEAGNPRPRFRLFAAPPAPGTSLTRCRDLPGEVLLDGEVRRLSIRGGREVVGGGPAAMEIAANRFEMELTGLKQDLRPLYGGRIEFRDGRSAQQPLRIVNSEPLVLSAGAPAAGSFDVRVERARLERAQVRLPGSDRTVSADFAAVGDVTLRIPVSGRPTELLLGSLQTRPTSIAAPSVRLPGLQLQRFDGRAERLEVRADGSGVAFNVAELGFNAKETRLPSGSSEAFAEESKGLIHSISAAAERSGNAILPTSVTVAATLEGTGCAYSRGGARLLTTRACSLGLTNSSDIARTSSFAAAQALTTLAAETIGSTGQVAISTEFGPDRDTFKATLGASSLKLGALEVDQGELALSATSADDVEIPFSLRIPPAAGTWRLRLPDGTLVMEGRLEEFALAGAIRLDPASESLWSIRIGQDQLRFAASIGAVYQPHVYGGMPRFEAGLRFRSGSDIEIKKDKKRGLLVAGAELFTVSNPEVTLGTLEGGMILNTPARFQGAVELGYDLATAKTRILSGDLVLLDARLKTKPGQDGDLGGIRITDGEVRLASLNAHFVPAGGRFLASDIKVEAARLGSIPVEEGGKAGGQLVWSGRPADAMRLGAVSGTIVAKSDGRLEVKSVQLDRLDVAIADASLGQGNGLRLNSGSLAVNFDVWSDEQVRGSFEMRDTRVAAAQNDLTAQLRIRQLSLTLTGGTPAKPSGSGFLLVSPLEVKLATEIKMPIETCDGAPGLGYKPLPVEVRFSAAALRADLTLAGGTIKGRGSSKLSVARIKNTGEYSCRKIIDWLLQKEVRAKYKYPCPSTRKPFKMCRGWTTIVPEIKGKIERIVRVRSLIVNAAFETLELRIKAEGSDAPKIRYCGKHGTMVPFIDHSYSIKPLTSIHVVDNIIAEFTKWTTRMFDTRLFFELGIAAGLILPNVIQEGMCFGDT
jgi:hypothetical protein